MRNAIFMQVIGSKNMYLKQTMISPNILHNFFLKVPTFTSKQNKKQAKQLILRMKLARMIVES